MEKIEQPILLSENLCLNRVTTKDAAVIYFLRSNEHVGKYIARKPQSNIQEAVKFINDRTEDVAIGKICYWGVFFKDSAELIGTICLWNFNKTKTVAEIGYDLVPKYQGNGYMTQAVALVLDFGFRILHLQQIDAFTQIENAASIKLLVNKGFVLNTNRKDLDVPKNNIYELLQKDYLKS